MKTLVVVFLALWLLATALGVRVLFASSGRAGAQVRRMRWRSWGGLVMTQAVPLTLLWRLSLLSEEWYSRALVALLTTV